MNAYFTFTSPFKPVEERASSTALPAVKSLIVVIIISLILPASG